ncbi:MAG TPA: BPSS1780 family membrane protein, partial [Burkholderiaceae bacterium]|nr:BPSS1780 family membrane protein [Burkholderiaceae bacterium]
MEKLPAKSGWLWVKEGFALFRKQPAEMSTLFMAYMFLMLVVGLVPLLGQVLPLFLVPIFSIGFLQACANVERGQRVFPNLLLTGCRSPARNRLLQLGVLYLLAAILAIALSSIID